MKTLLPVFTRVFTLMFSATSIAECTRVFACDDGNNFFMDFKRTQKHDGFLYYWYLDGHLKPTDTWTLSFKIYQQGVGISKIDSDLKVGVWKIYKIMDAA